MRPDERDGRDERDERDDENPVLTDEEDTQQRGDDPPGSFGHTEPPSGDLDPDWAPSDDVRDAAEELIRQLGDGEHRPRREDVHPYLLIRAYSPGDRGARPTWPSIPCWESPDILLIDAAYTGPFSPSRLVVSPTAGRRYRVFVRVWNLGLLAAVGVHVRAWYVDPGFFGGDPSNPAYQPQPIGMTVVPQLEDRTRPGAVQVVELDEPWEIPRALTGHECLLASASCPLDEWDGALDANQDRHVGQRNLTVLAGGDDVKTLLLTLGGMVTERATLELRHGGAAVTPLLQALLADTETEFGTAAELRAPSPRQLRRGVRTGTEVHLLTMFLTDDGWLVADSARVWDLAVELGLVEPDREEREEDADHPFAQPLGTRRIVEQLGTDRAEQLGVLSAGDPGEALLEGMSRLWDLDVLEAGPLAQALAGGGPSAHLLRFSLTDPDTEDSGGYSVTVIG